MQAGVQYISIRLGGWDDHHNLWDNYPERAAKIDKVLAVFLDDIRKQGMEDEVIFTMATEFGRTPKLFNSWTWSF